MNFEFPCFDPVFLDLFGPIDLRWYGLTYVAGFVIAQFVLGRLAKSRFLPLEPVAAGDLLFWCIFGVLVGGRLGYALFYEQSLLNPVELVQIWKGGMSFHGGLVGVFVALMLFARRRGVNWRRIGDAAAIAVTPGIFLVRCANFVNGELFGRTTSSDTFGAMRFPTDPVALREFGLAGIESTRSKELALQYACGHREWDDVLPRLATHSTDELGNLVAIDWEKKRALLDWDRVAELVPYRHASQLYEGISEGLLLGLLLWLVLRITRANPLGPGAYGGLFLVGYGVARFLLEFVRQPDLQFAGADDPIGTVFIGMTMGQTLSSVMVLAGLFFIATARRSAATTPPAQA